MVALMVKSILKACESEESNLQTMLRFRLELFQPYKGGRWEPSLARLFYVSTFPCEERLPNLDEDRESLAKPKISDSGSTAIKLGRNSK